MDAQALIEALGLEPHVEGGWFRRTYQAEHRPMLDTDAGPRFTQTSIFYLLTRDAPVGRWHRNRSDILHFFHLGGTLEYAVIDEQAGLSVTRLGGDLGGGQQLQLAVKGGSWKASRLLDGDYALVSEAVCPGFDYADMELGEVGLLMEEYPQHADVLQRFVAQA